MSGSGQALERRRAPRFGGDVAGDRGDAHAGGVADFRSRALQHVAGARDDGDVDAFARDRERSGLAQAAARTAEKRLPAADAEVHFV